MSIGIVIKFLTGRFHSTPWNHQVNEGVVEWPPSPWRILRALVSSYYRQPQSPSRGDFCQLMTLLANALPSYQLPPSEVAHTRHYMPVWKEGKPTTTKIFDTFLVLGKASLRADHQPEMKVIWPEVSLSESQLNLLKLLCESVSYLGRAESWVQLSIMDENTPYFLNAFPVSATDNYAEENLTHEAAATAVALRVKVLAPLTSEGLEGFREALSIIPKSKKSKWKAPLDILEALELDINQLHSETWNGIPGTRWVNYYLETPQPDQHLGERREKTANSPTLARFALVSPVLPNLTDAVSVGERFRQALMKWSEGELGEVSRVFLGRNVQDLDQEGNAKYLKGQQHAWYLPEVNEEGKITHIVVYAHEGFNQEVLPLQKLRKIWGREGFDIQTVLVALGEPDIYGIDTSRLFSDDFSALLSEVKQRQPARSLVVGKGKRWRSLTPMVLPRHPKCNRRGEWKYIRDTEFQVDGPEHQVLRLLRNLPWLPEGNGVESLVMVEDDQPWLGWVDGDDQIVVKVRSLNKGLSRYPWHSFRRSRTQGEGAKAYLDRAYWLEIEFREYQRGPIALGYAAHFGLGVFVPIPSFCGDR